VMLLRLSHVRPGQLDPPPRRGEVSNFKIIQDPIPGSAAKFDFA
jgi:hypothetical protein